MTLTEALSAASIERPSIVAIGTFDGVHIGHQHLIAQVWGLAHERGAAAVVITFHPRPVEVLRPGTPSLYLCSLQKRVQLLRQAGADVVIPVEFTVELSQMTAFAFSQALVDLVHMRTIVGGPDLAIGRAREGTADVLTEIGLKLGFDVRIANSLQLNGEPVRSTVVQRSVLDGDVVRAAALLGRRYTIEGTVIRGAGRGRTIGIPTANLAVPEKIAVPANGVYAVYFHEGGRRWHGAANLGVRPTFDGVGRSIEVHLLDFNGDLYGRHCEVEFVERLRPEMRFGSIDDLVVQINQDIQRARQILSAVVLPNGS